MAARGPVVVLLGERCADEAHDGVVVGEDLHDVRESLDLFVEPLEGVVRPDLAPVIDREPANANTSALACP